MSAAGVRGATVRGAVVVAAAALLAAAAGCTDTCASNCSAPVFDLSMGRINDLSSTQDLATDAAAIIAIGPGGANAFAPATVTIQAGQSVAWRWVTGFHSVVSDSMPKAFADSPAQASGQYVASFAATGTYPYHCGIHGTMMSGTVVVQ